MKKIVSIIALLLSLSALADSSAMKLVLEQPEVQKLEQDLETKGFILYQVVDKFAKTGVVPRCPCESVELKFTGEGKIKTYSVKTTGFGRNIKVTIEEDI
jgi:hypothetical protein